MAEHEHDSRLIVPIEWHVPANLISRYANNVVVQHGRNEFIISFFEILPPLILGSDEEKKAQLEKISSVQAECVARIILSPEQVEEIIRVLQDTLEKYQGGREEEEDRE